HTGPISRFRLLGRTSDLAGVFSTPINSSAVFWARLGEATFHSSWMLIIFGFPILVSYGYTTGSPWYYYPFAFFIMLPFIMIPATIGFFFVVALLYWVPIKRVRAVMVGIAITFGLILVYVLRLFSPRLLVQPETARDLFFKFLDNFEAVRLEGLPSYHAAYFLHELTRSGTNFPWDQLLWLLGLAAGTLLICGWLGQRWYKKGWLRTREGQTRRQTGQNLSWLKKLFNFLPRPYNALCRKEALLFLRETTQWAQLLVLVGIVIVHVVNLTELAGAGPLITHLLYFGNMILIGFVITAISVRFVFPSLSFEGKAFWIIRTGPLSMFQLFWQKTIFYLVPLIFIGSSLVFLTNWMLPIAPRLLGWSVLFIGSITVTLTAGALALGALFPKFDYEHFAEVVTGAGSVLYMLCGLFYVALVIGASTLPLVAQFKVGNPENWQNIFAVSGFEETVLGLSLFSLLVGGGLLWLAARTMSHYDFTRA
ncbi:MAG: putative ABC transporter permease subunit, partial [bacterium]